MTDHPLCRHYHPIRYAWACGAGFRAPRDCAGCGRYDADRLAGHDDDQTRLTAWKKAVQDRRPSS